MHAHAEHDVTVQFEQLLDQHRAAKASGQPALAFYKPVRSRLPCKAAFSLATITAAAAAAEHTCCRSHTAAEAIRVTDLVLSNDRRMMTSAMPHVHASCCVQKPKADSLSGLVKQRARARKEQVGGGSDMKWACD